MGARSITRVLLVEDNRALARTLHLALAEAYGDVRVCRSVAEVETTLAEFWPELALVDVVLPDGDALRVVELLERRSPAPLVIAMSGEALPSQSFALAERGVRAFLDKPLTLPRLDAVIRKVLETPPDLRPSLRQMVGHAPLADVEGDVRAVMIDEALAREDGNRRGAARLLTMSRQLLQYFLRRGR